MTGFDDFLIEHVYSMRHWPFCAVAVIFMAIGEVMKRGVWTLARARRPGKWRWFWYTGRVTLPIHPVFAGFAVGLVWDSPERYVSGPAACFYFAAAGTVSVWLYQLIKSALRRRGLRLDESIYPPVPDDIVIDEPTRPERVSNRPPPDCSGERPERPTVPYERGKRPDLEGGS